MKKTGGIIVFVVLVVLGAALYFVNKERNKYNDAMFSAVRAGNLGEVSRLIKQGANLNARDEAGQAPLHSAVYNGKTLLAEKLLNSGAEIDIKDNRGGTALHWAATRGKPDCILLLLKHGAKIDEQDKFEMTPLNWAISEGKVGNVKALLALGANPLLKNSRGKTAIDYAHEKNNKRIINLLEAGVR